MCPLSPCIRPRTFRRPGPKSRQTLKIVDKHLKIVDKHLKIVDKHLKIVDKHMKIVDEHSKIECFNEKSVVYANESHAHVCLSV